MAEPESRQSRYTEDQLYTLYSSIERWVDDANLTEPAYSANTMARDAWLRDFSRRESYLQGVISSAVSVDSNRGWSITGGRNQVRAYTNIFRNVHGGWRVFCAQNSLAYYSSDLGSPTELVFDVEGGNLRGLYNIDPARCQMTGNIEYPMRKYPLTGGFQDWKQDWFFRTVSMPSTDESMLDVGFCAVSRCLSWAKILVAYNRHDLEKLMAIMPVGMLLLQGILETDWETALTSRKEKLLALERKYYGGLQIFFSDMPMDAKLVALSTLPDGFNQIEATNMILDLYALEFGYDQREFRAVSSGAMGTATESEVQALKTTSKGQLNYCLGFQDNIQRELPDTLHWEFQQRNDRGEILEAQVAEAWARAINTMAAPSGAGMPETLSVEEKRQLLAQHGLIPEDWTIQEEKVTDTDTGDANRMLDLSTVRRAIDTFPDEQIVSYTWPAGTEKVIFDPMVIRRSYHFVVNRTYAEYEHELRGYARALRRGAINASDFDRVSRLAVEAWLNNAWNAGAELEGFSIDEYDDDDKKTIAKLINTEYTFLPNLTKFIEDNKDKPASFLDTRLGQWAARWVEVHDMASVRFGGDSKMEWSYDPAKEHCDDCALLHGQVRRAKEWAERGLHPLSMKLKCGPGRQCGCTLEKTKKRLSRGEFPKITGPGK